MTSNSTTTQPRTTPRPAHDTKPLTMTIHDHHDFKLGDRTLLQVEMSPTNKTPFNIGCYDYSPREAAAIAYGILAHVREITTNSVNLESALDAVMAHLQSYSMHGELPF